MYAPPEAEESPSLLSTKSCRYDQYHVEKLFMDRPPQGYDVDIDVDAYILCDMSTYCNASTFL